MKTAVVLIGHGTFRHPSELPQFLTNIRRGNPPPPELVHEVERRYEAIGGASPLLEISRRLAEKLEAKLGLPVRLAMRLWHPFPREVLGTLADEGIERVALVPLAQFSAHVYARAVEEAAEALAREGRPRLTIVSAQNWGAEPRLVEASAGVIDRAIELAPRPCSLVFSAHSLPVAAVRAGDPYEKDFRAAVVAVRSRLRQPFSSSSVAFQSQGLGGGEWLGPDLRATLESVRNANEVRHVVVAPIGFLADHVEILYDLDIEAKAMAETLGLGFSRSRSLNDSDELVSALEAVARPLVFGTSEDVARGLA